VQKNLFHQTGAIFSTSKMSTDERSAYAESSSSKKAQTTTSLYNFFNFGNRDDLASNKKLLEDKVLNQRDVDGQNRDSLVSAKASADNVSKDGKKETDIWGPIVSLMTSGKDANLDNLIDIFSIALASQEGELSETKSNLSPEGFKDLLHKTLKQLETNFMDVPMDKLSPMAFLYYLESQDAKKNPSWKRRIHRFMPSIKMETVHGLNDALYLSQLAYVDSVEEVQKGLADYQGAKYELVYCTTEGRPGQPAHFLVIKKEGSVPHTKLGSSSSTDEKPSIFNIFPEKTSIEVVLAIRGTKTLEDMFSDALLEATPYRGGVAHDGVCHSGKFLVEKHTDLLLNILKISGRDELKLTILGHSLGAGAAAIACIEWNDIEKIDASCIGFGCPALLNQEMSQKWKEKIVTIISDSDCVPRMSGSTGTVSIIRCPCNNFCPFQMLSDFPLPLQLPICRWISWNSTTEILQWKI
jgi:hypothetical protein